MFNQGSFHSFNFFVEGGIGGMGRVRQVRGTSYGEERAVLYPFEPEKKGEKSLVPTESLDISPRYF